MKHWLNSRRFTALFALFFHWWTFLHQKIITCILCFFTKPYILSGAEAVISQVSCPLKMNLLQFRIFLEEVQTVLACGIFISFF